MATEIIIAGRSPDEGPMAETLNEAETTDEMNYEAMSPEGDFKMNSMNALVKATNKLLPAFGQAPDYPTFSEDVGKFPTEFTRILAMFSAASKDAADAEVIEPDLVVSLDDITDDRSVLLVSGKIDAMSRNKDFKKFLKEPMPQQEEEEEMESGAEMAMAGEEMDDAAMDELFMGRM
jgi:hypothetical protein